MTESTRNTTSRTTWRLKKYSCAYAAGSERPITIPAPRLGPCSSPSILSSTTSTSGYQSDNSTGTQNQRQALEWVHCSDPGLLCELTTPSSTLGSTFASSDSPTLRILFQPLHSNQSTQSTLMYQDLDLASFASPQIQAICPPDELAIRAVYKASMVGIRYFSAERKLASIKRFQLNFENHEEVLQFLDATKAWIPAKPSSDTQPSSSRARITIRHTRTTQAPIVPTPCAPATLVTADQLDESKVYLAAGSSRADVGRSESAGNSWPRPIPTSSHAQNWPSTQHLVRSAQLAVSGEAEQSGTDPAPTSSLNLHLDSDSMARLDRMLPRLRGALRAPEEEPSARGPNSEWNDVRAEGDQHRDIESANELAELDDASLLNVINNIIQEPGFEKLVERVNGLLQCSDGRT
ncbi:hypothetical protein MVLG_02594 [Microbotryum lychnidis-dioicae p1A1 Lamole]|uniref:Uncharacterized protein n=1 Tax=Microbotryum lychnidis-dioicae (strain p1A1 Lamole / MvSl-1064) TaxID=683840 RepID=U5H5M6_USTV1|nr:hypothetical protein MVLG_02594 [Microbotryum lychnidis-dioicae p1A1 Lamole]|eukprot:KDE07194.1 hypothetical protein MVLG_02594 [Microbotryum lychnidis-dioicae p1A1 Lamole]